MEDAVAAEGRGSDVTEIGEGVVKTIRKDELGGVRKDELVERAAGAYSEPYAPLPGWNNRSCICAVENVLGSSVEYMIFSAAAVHESFDARSP